MQAETRCDIPSTFEPPVDSTHLSDLPPPVSPLSDMDIDIDSWPGDSFIAEIMADDSTTPGSSHEASSDADTSMPSFTFVTQSDSSDSNINMGDSTLPSVNVPEYPDEDSIEESLPIGGIAADNPEVDYMLVPAASSCGGDKLTDTNGFSYGVKRKNNKHTLWRCSVCNRHVTYKATVLQEGNSFTRGPHPHLHPSQPGITRSLQTRKQINSMALSDISHLQ